MSVPFALALAWRELRSSARRVGVYMASITLGVAALVAVNSFRSAVVAGIERDARAILGADLRLGGSEPIPDPVLAELDALAGPGNVARIVSVSTMALAPGSGATRLLMVQAVQPGYPFHGDVATRPAGLWPPSAAARAVVLDSAALAQLDVRPGDSLLIGSAAFTVAGTVNSLPGDVSFRGAIAPRAYIALDRLEETGILAYGSFSRHYAYARVEDRGALQAFVEEREAALREAGLDFDTAAEQAENLASALGWLGDFLGLVGLMALLLGGIGVASAVHVFAREKLPAIAMLRCLGARQRSVFGAYLLQAAVLGLAGALAGVLLGVAVQALLPRALADLLPVEVAFRFDPAAAAAGLGVGLIVAVLFALIPLLAVRDVAPLQALRQDVEPAARRLDPLRLLAGAALVATLLALSLWQAPDAATGLGFAAAITAVVVVLWGTAALLGVATRRLFPRRASFVVRQGVANLFRPRNQTVAVVLALGFGVFLIATLDIVQRNLLDRLRFEGGAQPNLLLFDVQPDQLEEVRGIVARAGSPLRQVTPMVPARLARIGTRPVGELLADTTEGGPEAWALRREYRHTYRDTLTAPEKLVEGEWWTGPREPGTLPRVSVDADLADDLRVGLGDTLVWDVQGVEIATRITSLREIDWARFEPNFFVVFEPGVLEEAPQMIIALARIEDPAAKGAVQRELVSAHPNVSVLDLATVQQALDAVTGRATTAVSFLAAFGVLGGIIVLAGALATSRFQRMREGALLRTLGARRAQVRWIAFVEYLALGGLAGLAGVLLATLAGWALVDRLFELEFRLPVAGLVALWLGVAGLALVVGVLNTRQMERRSPLETLRQAGE